jgi:hypothetical protein
LLEFKGRAREDPFSLVFIFAKSLNFSEPTEATNIALEGVEILEKDEDMHCYLEHRYMYEPIKVPIEIHNEKVDFDKILELNGSFKDRVCFLVPSTSRNSSSPSGIDDLKKLEALHTLFPSILARLTGSHEWSIYIGYDIGDPVYDDPKSQSQLLQILEKMKPRSTTVNFVVIFFFKPS